MTGVFFQVMACASVPPLVAWGATAFLRRGPASFRHLLWAGGLIGMLVVTLLRPPLPKLEIPILAPEPRLELAGAEPAAPPARDDRVAAPVADAGQRAARAGSAAAAPDARPGIDPARLLWLLYLAGVVLLASHLLLSLLRLARLARSADPLPASDPWRRDLERLDPRWSGIDLLTSARVHGPLLIGLPRALILPEAALGWSRETRHQILVHELAHLRRRDWLTQLAAWLAITLHWFNPLAWLAGRRLMAEAEMACDDSVLLAGTADTDYAQQLLELTRSARRESLLAVAMARRGQLSGRIESILDPECRRLVMTRKQILATSFVLLPLIVALGALQPVAARAPQQERSLDHQLVAAAERGDVGAVRRALRSGADPDHRLPGTGTALIVAAARGDVEVVRELLEAGADPGLQVRDRLPMDRQRTALTTAARNGHRQIVELLLDAGAEVDAIAPGDATALIEAARHGHEDVVDTLLAAGADARRSVAGDGDALTGAAAGGHRGTADLLLRSDADPDQWTDGDESPFFHAVSSGDAELVARLLDYGADPNTRWHGDGNPLILAARHGSPEVLETLLLRGADPNASVHGDGSPLIAAVASGHLEAARRLIEAGADVDLGVRGDGNPLIAGAASGHLEAVRLLVEAGADLDLVVPGDENALIQAAAHGRLETARYLLDAGADPDIEVVVRGWRSGDREVRTALSMARRNGHREVADLLLQYGARQ